MQGTCYKLLFFHNFLQLSFKSFWVSAIATNNLSSFPNETMKILLTGATGTLGSAILEKLRTQKDQVYCLVRNKSDQPAEECIKNSSDRVVIVPGDIIKPLAGISAKDIELIKQVDAVLHCAASIDFGLSKAAETADININGTRNMLELAIRIGAKNFYHVSTSYVAGDAEYFSENDSHANQLLRNPYEKTKFAGEELVRLICAQANMGYTIFRPTVIVGDSKSGKISSFEGYYGFFKYIVSMRDKVRDQAKKKDKEIFAQMIRGDKVRLPITVRCSFKSTINLVPINWVVDTISYFLRKKAEDRVYHLVDENPQKVKWVIEKTLEHLGIRCAVLETTDLTKQNFANKNMARIAETM